MSPYRQSEWGSRFAWARLNADSLFVGLLVMASGLFTAAVGEDVVSARAGGATTPLFVALWVSYVSAGVLLVVALMKASVRLEVVARSLFIGGTLLNVYRSVVWLGSSAETWGQVVLLGIVVLTSGLRGTVLLGKSGMLIHRPGIDEEGSK